MNIRRIRLALVGMFLTGAALSCSSVNSLSQIETEDTAVVSDFVLVAGGTGRTGSQVVKHLLAGGKSVRVLVRDAEKAASLFGESVDIHVADVTDAMAVRASVVGVTDIISAIGSAAPSGPNSPEFVDYGGVKNLVDAAVLEGVDQFVLVSSSGATKADHPLNAMFGNVMIWKLKGEDALRASGIDYTVVRPGGLRDDEGGQTALLFDQGDRLAEGMISRDDVAEVTVMALDIPAARNRTFEVVSTPGDATRQWGALFESLSAD